MKAVKILVVEDEALIGLHLEMELKRAGYAVVGPVASGEEAIDMARHEGPDVVLMDIRLMGEMDGIEAARQIGGFSQARIIFTTGYQDSALKERAMALKPLAYLLKPIGVRQIGATLAEYLH